MTENREVADRLKLLCKKHIDTTMIGALSAIETAFGNLWNQGSEFRNDDEEEWYKLYQQLRSKVLDTGNGQKRNMDKEFEHFDVSLHIYHYDMKVKPRVTKREE